MWDKTDNRWIATNCNAYNNILGDLIWFFCPDSKTSLFFANGKAYDQIPSFNITVETDEDTYKLYAMSPTVFVDRHLEPDATDGGGVLVIDGNSCWFRADGIVARPRNFTYTNSDTGDEETLGIRYWEGQKFNILTDATSGMTIELTEVNGEKSTATLEILPKSNIGWWTNTESSSVFGIYKGEGAYAGEYRYFGTPTWSNYSYNSNKIIAQGTDANNKLLLECSFISHIAAEHKYIIGSLNDIHGWYECSEDNVKLKSNLTFRAIKGEKSGPDSDLVFTWKGFADDPIESKQHWVMDVPVWR